MLETRERACTPKPRHHESTNNPARKKWWHMGEKIELSIHQNLKSGLCPPPLICNSRSIFIVTGKERERRLWWRDLGLLGSNWQLSLVSSTWKACMYVYINFFSSIMLLCPSFKSDRWGHWRATHGDPKVNKDRPPHLLLLCTDM